MPKARTKIAVKANPLFLRKFRMPKRKSRQKQVKAVIEFAVRSLDKEPAYAP